MSKFEKTIEVKQFADEDRVCEQSVFLNTDDDCEPWMIVSHAGNEISLSVNNWKSISELVNKVLKEANIYSEGDLQS